MKTTDLHDAEVLYSLPFSATDMPHGTIETNRNCNIECLNCYNSCRNHVKTTSQIFREIDLLLARRRIQTLTILGGEPTLHPDLVSVVRYVKSRKVKCQILTNGEVFLKEDGKVLLRALREAKVDRLTFHVDHGQRSRAAIVSEVRALLFTMCEESGVHFSLAVTVDDGDRLSLAPLIKQYCRFRMFDGIIAFMASCHEFPKYPTERMRQEYAAIKDELGIAPTSYVPSNLDTTELRWLIYHFMIDASTSRAIGFSSTLNRTILRVYRTVAGRFPFMVRVPCILGRISSLGLTLLDGIVGGSGLGRAVSWNLATALWAPVRFLFIAVQAPPELGVAGEQIEFCQFCPDATVRNGSLMPLCLADTMSPLDGSAGALAQGNQRFVAVLGHLNPQADRRLP